MFSSVCVCLCECAWTDRGSSSQLQRDGGNLRSLLECGGRQSGSQRVRRIGEFCSPSQPSASCVRSLTSCRPLVTVSAPGLCIRPAEIVLLCVGKPWTDHECVHSQMTVPACPAYCSRLRLWPAPLTDRQTDRQDAGRWNRMKAPGTAGPGTGLIRRTEGRALPLNLCGLNQSCRWDAVKSKTKKKKKMKNW